MRLALRLFVVASIFVSLTTFAAPRRFEASPDKGLSCCAQMQKQAVKSHGCQHHAPAKQEQDQSCCQMCSLGLLMLFVAPPSFIYAQTGEEEFLVSSVSSDAMPHRPPVPPPRV